MKKLVMIMVLVIVLMAVIFASAMAITQKIETDRGEQRIEALAEYTGMTYLGLIDTKAISKNSGYVYNGTAVVQELLRRAGLDEESDTWVFNVESCHGVDIRKLTVYQHESEYVPMFQRKIQAEYLFGEI